MMIFIDTDFKCYATTGPGREAVDVPAFDGKCAAYIAGYRYVPAGQTWTRSDGRVFAGEMIAPWKGYAWLAMVQAQHEADEAAHAVELAELVDIIYESNLEVIG